MKPLPDLCPCLDGCGRNVAGKLMRDGSTKPGRCKGCRNKRRRPHPCGDCGRSTLDGRRCEPCRRRHVRETAPPCPCGKPAQFAGVCDWCYTAARLARDPIARRAYAEKQRRHHRRRRARRKLALAA